jgi:hypothetical protein
MTSVPGPGRPVNDWKALIVLAGAPRDDPADAAQTRHVIEEIIADHRDAA